MDKTSCGFVDANDAKHSASTRWSNLLAILMTRSDSAVWAGHVDITLLRVLPTDV
jgi:hypothetical protein